MERMEVEVIVTAELRPPDAYFFRPAGNAAVRLARALRPGAPKLRSPCLAYVVRHPTAGTILIDTGMHPDVATDLRKDFGRLLSLVFRGIKPAAVPYDEQLRELGIDPGDPLRVIMTHLHVDHTSGMRLLPSATFLCTREEWAAAAHDSRAAAKGYAPHHLPDTSRVELVDFETNGEPHGQFPKAIDLLGDGSIRLVSTPGHTVGHMSVLVRGADERDLLLVGDAAYTLRSIDEQILPLLTADDATYRRTLRELKAFTEESPGATLIPSHDPAAWQALGATISPAA
jgi:N-acyl homoserine lactone hydrolase